MLKIFLVLGYDRLDVTHVDGEQLENRGVKGDTETKRYTTQKTRKQLTIQKSQAPFPYGSKKLTTTAIRVGIVCLNLTLLLTLTRCFSIHHFVYRFI